MYVAKSIKHLNSEIIGFIILIGQILLFFPDILIHNSIKIRNKKLKITLTILFIIIGLIFIVLGYWWLNLLESELGYFGSFSKTYSNVLMIAMPLTRVIFKGFFDMVKKL